MNNLSGHMIVKNGVKFDYPFVESCLSILPICDEFIFIEGSGNDGTYEKILDIQKLYPKIKVFREQWEKKHWSILSDLTNKAIEYCSCKYHLQIQADEIIHEKYHSEILKIIQQDFDFVFFGVLHFFSDFNTIYKNNVYYDKFIRLAKKSLYPNIRSYGDAMTLGRFADGNYRIGQFENQVKVHHYGYVRDPKALIEKAAEMFPWWGFQELDKFLEEGLKNKKIDWFMKHSRDKLSQFNEPHASCIRQWIKEREETVKEGIVK